MNLQQTIAAIEDSFGHAVQVGIGAWIVVVVVIAAVIVWDQVRA